MLIRFSSFIFSSSFFKSLETLKKKVKKNLVWLNQSTHSHQFGYNLIRLKIPFVVHSHRIQEDVYVRWRILILLLAMLSNCVWEWVGDDEDVEVTHWWKFNLRDLRHVDLRIFIGILGNICSWIVLRSSDSSDFDEMSGEHYFQWFFFSKISITKQRPTRCFPFTLLQPLWNSKLNSQFSKIIYFIFDVMKNFLITKWKWCSSMIFRLNFIHFRVCTIQDLHSV